MKCPKCGFTSFDYLDTCRKCGKDLSEHKGRFAVQSVLFPGLHGAGETGLTTPEAAETPEEALQTEARDATDFGFDFLEEAPPEGQDSGPAADNPPPAPQSSPFEDLLREEEKPAAAGPPPADIPPREEAASEPPPQNEEAFSNDLETDEDFSFDDFDLDLDDAGPGGEEESPGRKRTPPAASKDKGEPSDPFDLREFAVAGRAPEAPNGQAPEDPQALPPLPELGTSPGEEAFAPLPDAAVIDGDPSLHEAAGAETESPAADGKPDQPPDETGTEEEKPSAPAPPGHLVARLGACLADLLLLGGIFALFVVVGQRLLYSGSESLWPRAAVLLRLSTPYFLILFAFTFGYFTLFHFLVGQTPGKMLFGLGVEAEDGRLPSPSQAFLRSVGGLAACCCAGLGFLPILFDELGRGWNDRLAGTRVARWGISAKGLAAADPPTTEPG